MANYNGIIWDDLTDPLKLENDYMKSYAGDNNILFGDVTIEGDAGDDDLVGGEGNDLLLGSTVAMAMTPSPADKATILLTVVMTMTLSTVGKRTTT